MRFSPTTPALEAFRIARREPASVLAWTGLWLAALMLTAVVLAFGGPIRVVRGAPSRSLGEVIASFGPFAALFVVLFLTVWATTTVAAFRAVLRPKESAWFFLRLGPDEARLAVMTVSALVLVLILGGAPAFLLLALLSPLMAAAPSFARDLASGGAIATVALDIWLVVRLSLIAVETFDERRFHLTAYWPLARGRFWYLLAAYAICFALFFAILALFGLAGGAIAWAVQAVGAPVGADPLRRGLIFALAALLAALAACFFVVTSTLFCACQARAYAVIAGRQEAGKA